MTLENFNWDVVVAGYWNPAILTPAGIALRLFGLPEGTPVLIEVPMDGLAPSRVRYEDLTVTAALGRLSINADNPRYDLLDRARGVAVKAMKGLPETPLTAAGYNIRMKISDPTNELLAATTCGIDGLLSDAAFSIKSQNLCRSLELDDGVINLNIQQNKDVTVEINFHCQSSRQEELIAWMNFPIKKVEEIVSTLLEKVIRIPKGEVNI
jgi:hypothetical protein